MLADSCVLSSSPRSLLVGTLAGASAELVVNTSAMPSSLVARLAFRLDELNAGTSSSAHFLTVRCASSDKTELYAKVEQSGELGITQSGGPDPSATLVVPRHAWKHIEMALTALDAGIGVYAVVVTVDGALYASFTTVPFACDAVGLVVEVGSHVSGGGGTVGDYVLHIDDVTVGWH